MRAAPVTRDLYRLLGIRRDADQEAIKKAFRERALMYHPDRNPGEANEAQFKEANRAHEVLSDRGRRALYDEFGEESLSFGFDPQQARQRVAASQHAISAQPWVVGQRGNGPSNAGFAGVAALKLIEWLQTAEGREASRRTKAFLQALFGNYPNEPKK